MIGEIGPRVSLSAPGLAALPGAGQFSRRAFEPLSAMERPPVAAVVWAAALHLLLSIPGCVANPFPEVEPRAADELPDPFFPGRVRLDLVVGGERVPLDVPATPRWRRGSMRADGEIRGAEVDRSGWTCELPVVDDLEILASVTVEGRNTPRRGRLAVRVGERLAGSSAFLRAVFAPTGFGPGSTWTRQYESPGADGDVVSLALDGAVPAGADTLFDPRSGLQLRLSSPAGGPPPVLARAPRRLPSESRGSTTPSGETASFEAEVGLSAVGDVPLLQWELGQAAPLPAARRVAPIHPGGWGFFPSDGTPSEAAVLGLADAIDRLDPPAALRTIELGRGWQDAVRRLPEAGGATPARFPEGLAPVVSTLALRRFQVALWMCPFGTEAVPPGELALEGLILDGDGRPVTGAAPGVDTGPFGRAIWDPTSTAGWSAIRDSVGRTLEVHGPAVGILRIGRLDELDRVYREQAMRLHLVRSAPTEEPGSRDEIAGRAMEAAIAAIRAGAGGRRLLAGDWDTPAVAARWLDVSRPRSRPADGGDLLRREALSVWRGLVDGEAAWRREGFLAELDRSPDGLVVRQQGLGEPAPFRSWLDLRCLSGRSFFFDRKSVVDDAAASSLRRRWPAIQTALPVLATRALAPDLAPRASPPRVWVLEVPVSGQPPHRVIGVFNWNPFAAERIRVALGSGGCSLVFDAHAARLLGVARESIDLLVAPRSSRLLSVHACASRPLLVADDARRILGPDLVSSVSWNDESRTLDIGLIGEESPASISPSRTLHVVLPRGRGRPRIRVSGSGAAATATFEREGVHCRVRVPGSTARLSSVRLEIDEDPGGRGAAPPPDPPVVRAEHDPATGGVWLEWDPPPSGQADRVAGFEVYRDGEPVGRTFDSRFLDLPSEPFHAGEEPRYGIALRMTDGAVSRPGPESACVVPVPKDLGLTRLAPVEISQSWGFPGRDATADGRAIDGGGLGVAVPSRIVYDLRERFQVLRTRAVIDGGADLWTRARFVIRLDGRTVFESGDRRYGDPPVAIEIPVAGARELVLEARSWGESPGPKRRPLVSWLSPALLARAPPAH